MKTYLLFLCICIATSNVLFAQAPQGFQYQAVIRDNTGSPLLNASVQFRFTLEDNTGVTEFYQETQSVVTNVLGGIAVVIGKGNPVSGNFAGILWKSGAVRARIELDPTGGNNFSPFGITYLQSVPYALYADQAGALDDDASIDPGQIGDGGATIGQVLIWNGTQWVPGDDQDEQTLQINGNQLSISNGNAVTLPPGSGGGDNWGNQTVVSDSPLSGNGTLSFPLKIAQQGALNGDVLKWNGNSWVPQSDVGVDYVSGPGIGINGNIISNTGDNDNDPSNEIQTLSINGNVLSLSNGGMVNLPNNSYTSGTGINIAANIISALNTQNIWNANQLQNINVSANAPSNGQILKYNGSSWAPGTDNGQTYVEGTGISISGNTISAQNNQELWNASQLRSFNLVDVAPLDGQILKYTSTGGGWLPQNITPTYWQPTGNNIYYSNNVGIGTSSPASRLHISGGPIQIEDQTLGKYGGNSLEFSSHIVPLVDNNRSLGLSNRRFTAVWAVDGTINTSDAREKKNIKALTYGLDAVMKMKPVSFQWRDRNDGKNKLGLLAQDLELVIPEVVTRAAPGDDSDSDRLGVYYSDLIPVLIKAIQEQEVKINMLQQEIEILKQH